LDLKLILYTNIKRCYAFHDFKFKFTASLKLRLISNYFFDAIMVGKLSDVKLLSNSMSIINIQIYT